MNKHRQQGTFARFREHNQVHLLISLIQQLFVQPYTVVAVYFTRIYRAKTIMNHRAYNDALERYTALEAEKTKRVRKSKELKAFTKTLKQQPLVVAQ